MIMLTAKPFLLNVFDFLLSKFLRRSSRRNDFGIIHGHSMQSLSLDEDQPSSCVTNLLYVTRVPDTFRREPFSRAILIQVHDPGIFTNFKFGNGLVLPWFKHRSS